MVVRTRFAPSPTGYLHIGGSRTALFSWLYARHHNGIFVLRVEDTDRDRSTPESVQAILDGMTWLGLDCDEGPYYQSERFDRYREVLDHLLSEGYAYRCYCSKERLKELRDEQLQRKEKPRYDGRCRDLTDIPEGVAPVIRFRTPDEGEVVVEDRVYGTVRYNNSELDDLVLARADGVPTYNLSVVVDDLDMGITHVIRGDDHLNNTPRQFHIWHALGAEPPVYAHVPMILGADGKRLSKRHGAVSVMQYREEGYLPEALVNYLVRLGWSYGDQEIFSRDEMIQLFDIAEVNRAASSFNPEKLLWLNQHYMKTLDPGYIAEALQWHLDQIGVDTRAGPRLEDVVTAYRERVKTLREMAEAAHFFFKDFNEFEPAAAAKHLKPAARSPLADIRARLAGLQDWTPEAIHTVVAAASEAHGLKMGKVAQPLRVAVTGTAVSPPIDVTVCLLGRDTATARIDRALAYIDDRADTETAQ